MTKADTQNMIDLVERRTGYRVTVDVISGIYEHAQMISARPEAPAHIIRVNADRRRHADYKMKADPLHGFFSLAPSDGERAGVRGNQDAIVEYEPDSELRDFEQIPLLKEGGIPACIRREVLPYTPDAWLVEADTKIGYEVSFTRHFYQPPQLRTLAQISADILALEQETEGLLHEITKGASA